MRSGGAQRLLIRSSQLCVLTACAGVGESAKTEQMKRSTGNSIVRYARMARAVARREGPDSAGNAGCGGTSVGERVCDMAVTALRRRGTCGHSYVMGLNQQGPWFSSYRYRSKAFRYLRIILQTIMNFSQCLSEYEYQNEIEKNKSK